MAAVYLIVTEPAVLATTELDAVTFTEIFVFATPLRFTEVFEAMPLTSECLYWVPEEIIATGDGVRLAGPGPMILKVYVPIQVSPLLPRQLGKLEGL
jgi:hypothetical protein